MIALVVLDLAAMAGPEVVEGIAGELAVLGERAHVVVDVAVVADVGMTEVDQSLGQLEHLRDVLGGTREDMGGQDVDRRLVDVECRLVRVGDLRGRLVLQAGGDEHPILAAVEALVAEVADVGDVLDVEDLDAVVEEHAPDQVGEHERPEVADVGEAVDGRAARIHPDAATVRRENRLNGPAEGVPEAEGHAGNRTAATPVGSGAGQETRPRVTSPPGERCHCCEASAHR